MSRSASETSQRAANRRTALGIAAKHLDSIGDLAGTDAAWASDVAAFADLLLPWLNADLPSEDAP